MKQIGKKKQYDIEEETGEADGNVELSQQTNAETKKDIPKDKQTNTK